MLYCFISFKKAIESLYISKYVHIIINDQLYWFNSQLTRIVAKHVTS